MPKPFTMESRYDGYCKKCKSNIKKGDVITKEDGRWVHFRCPTRTTINSLLSIQPAIHEVSDANLLEELEKKVFIPSVYQQAVFDWALQGTGNAVIEAVAGSGKTTTIVKLLEYLPSHLRILFVAFNKEIVKQLKRRVPKHIRVCTLNSLGFSVIRKADEFQDLDDDKVSGILNEFWAISRKEVPDPKKRSENRIKRAAMRKIVELVKSTLIDFYSETEVLALINRFKIDIDEQLEAEVIEKLPFVMEKNNENVQYVDLNDQVYLPVTQDRFSKLFDQYDFILGDECQDWNAANIQLILKCLAPGGRLVAVGDRRQSLYGFRGADTKAIPHLIEWTNAQVLPLSICYRCPSSHIEAVKHIVPQIEAAPGAKVGTLGELEYEGMMAELREGDLVMCRTNAPLIKPAFACIKEKGMKAIIKGKDIGRDLVNYIDKFQCDELGRLDVLMQEHTEMEINRYLEKNKEMMAEQVKERYQTIVEVMKECADVAQLVTRIETLFSDDNEGVVFSSIHRAKGTEAERVFLYRPDLMPHPKAKTEDELEQEDNTLYVARTRSLDTLYLVKSWED